MNSRPLRVLHLRSTFTYAGPEAVFINLAPGLVARGVQVKLVAHYRRGPGEPETPRVVAEAVRLGIPAEAWEDTALFSLGVVNRLARELRDGHFDLLHTHDHKADLMGWLAARRAGVPCVATVHLHDVAMWKSRVYRAIDLQVLRLFPLVIVVSHALREELRAAGIDDRRLRVIHNGIDASRFADEAAQRRLAWRAQGEVGEAPLIVTVGRLFQQKGMDQFLLAAARVHAARPEARFWIVGDGPLRGALETQAASLGLEKVVRLLGAQQDIAGIMAASDVLAMASRREGLPVVLLEALALARPVVATCVGGIPEVIEDRVTGLLVQPNQPEALADRLLEVLAQPERAAEMGLRALARIRAEFAAEASAERTVLVYRELLGRSQERA